MTSRETINLAAYVGLRVADDVAYGAGVWLGAIEQHSSGALAPKFTNWPRTSRRLRSLHSSHTSAGMTAPTHQAIEDHAAEADREHGLQRCGHDQATDQHVRHDVRRREPTQAVRRR